MKTWSLALLLWASTSAALPTATSLSSLFLDQKDALFYETGVLRSGMPSSLCGPTSAVNWLQLRQSQEGSAYAKEELVRIVRIIGSDLQQRKVDMNNGLTERELIQFLELLDERLGEKKSYQFSSASPDVLWKPEVQILLLNYSEPARRTVGPMRREDYSFTRAPVAGRHFVLKVFTDPQASEAWLIDPENPGIYTKVKVESGPSGSLRVLPQSREGLASFGLGTPLIWTLTGIIREN